MQLYVYVAATVHTRFLGQDRALKAWKIHGYCNGWQFTPTVLIYFLTLLHFIVKRLKFRSSKTCLVNLQKSAADKTYLKFPFDESYL